MKISVIGCGYLGAVHAAAMAELGHEVVGVDVDPHKVELLSQGKAPFVEPDFDEILSRWVQAGTLRFTTDIAEVRGCSIHFIGVGTPQVKGGYQADMTYVWAAVDSLKPHLGFCTNGPEIVAGKSTVPVGTAAQIAQKIADTGVHLVWNPEFLREGFAVKDTLTPDRMVYGLSPDPKIADICRDLLDELYAPIIAAQTPRLLMDYQTAELVKVSANAFLATKISFINAMARICDAADADVTQLAEAIGMDERIGKRFLRAGIGFGGGCLPKDIRAFMARAEELGETEALRFLREIDDINTSARDRIVDYTRSLIGWDLSSKKVAVLGAAFKPDSDDMRDSPALAIAARLCKKGAEVSVTDPAATSLLRSRGKLPFHVVDSVEETVRDADLVIIATEWKQYRNLDPKQLFEFVAEPIIIDGRNCLDPFAWKEAGWTYCGIGRR